MRPHSCWIPCSLSTARLACSRLAASNAATRLMCSPPFVTSLDWKMWPKHSATRSISWPCTDGHNNAGIVVGFAQDDCRSCGRRTDCTRGQKQGRQLMLRRRDQHLALRTARAWQETADFKEQYARRAGVEGTFTQANRRADLRHARYLGLAKTHLQNVITAVALNLLRMLAWLGEVPRATTRTSPFARLMTASPG